MNTIWPITESKFPRKYSDDAIEKLIKIAGGLPKGKISAAGITGFKISGDNLDFPTIGEYQKWRKNPPRIYRKEALMRRLELAAREYQEGHYRPLPPSESRKYYKNLGKRCEGLLKTLDFTLEEIDYGMDKKEENYICEFTYDYGDDDLIRGILQMRDFAKKCAESSLLRVQKRNAFRTRRQKDWAMDRLFCSLITIWAEVFEKEISTGTQNPHAKETTDAVNGIIIDFFAEALKPIELKKARRRITLTKNAIRERIRSCRN